jgi:tetratricopeptide (TPR) repeat protein
MKKILLLVSLIIVTAAQAQIKMPAASSTQTIVQNFGLGTIELTYSRPNIKGRVVFKENSELAPLGKVWRTGANAVTKLKITDPVMIGGKAVDTGSYALWTIPGKSEWTIIINKDAKNWGTVYVEADDLLRFTIPTEKMKESMETLTMQFAEIKPESCELHIMWSNVDVKIPFTSSVKERVRAQVEKALTADNITANTYFAAANFYYEYDKDFNKALPLATKAAESNPKAYYFFLLKAKIEKDLGDKASAKADAEKCITGATEAKNDDYVRAGKELISKL